MRPEDVSLLQQVHWTISHFYFVSDLLFCFKFLYICLFRLLLFPWCMCLFSRLLRFNIGTKVGTPLGSVDFHRSRIGIWVF